MKFSTSKILVPIALITGIFFTYFSLSFAATSVTFLDGSTLSLNWTSPATLEAGTTFVDTGAIWSNSGGTLTGTITSTSGAVNNLLPGNYILEYSKTFSGETRTISWVIQVRDTIAPVLTLSGSASQTVEASTGAYVDPGARWTDIVDGSGSVTSYSGSINMQVPWVYVVQYKKIDSSTNTSNILSRTVTVVDTTAPKVTLNGASTITIEAGSSFAEQWASVYDIVDGSSTISNSTSGTVNNVLPGTYTLTYQKVDAHGNTGSVNRTVIVQDTIAPTINLVGSWTQTFEASTGTYSDPGASYSDTVIGIGSIPLATSGSVNMKVPGTYTLTYSKTDTSWNSGSVTRTVTITDTTPPSMSLNGSWTQTLEAFSGVYTDSGATWTDIVDGSGIVISYSGSVNTKLPWNYTLLYRKIDAHGNTGAILSRTVTIIDTTPPVLTLSGASSVTLEATLGTYTDPGVTWTDIVDNTGSIATAYSGSVNMKVPGAYTLLYRKIDNAGNTGSISRTVTIIDTTPPVLTLSGVTPMTIAHGSVFTDPGVTWSDIVDNTGNVSTAYSGSVNTNQVGSYVITYRKIDNAGNTGSISRTVLVTDQTPPVLSLNGTSPVTVYIGSSYTDPGATWIDAVDGSGSVLAYSGSVNTSVLWTYILQYRKADLAWNMSSIISRTVIIDPQPSSGGPSSGWGGGGWGGSYIAPSTSSSISGGGSSPALSPSSLTGSTATGITSTGTTKIVTSIQKPKIVKKVTLPKVIVSTPIKTPEKTTNTTPVAPVIEKKTPTITQATPTIVSPTSIDEVKVVKIENIQVPEAWYSLVANQPKINIRLAPSLDAKILGYLVRWDKIQVLSIQDGWIQFQYQKIIGWSKAGFFAPVENNTSSIVSETSTNISTISPVKQDSSNERYFANVPKVNLRPSPNDTHKPIGYLVGWQNIKLIRILWAWSQVQTEEGNIGWVYSKYLTKR